MPGVAVVHLVRRQNDLAALQRFAETYRAHQAGVAHDLVILFKGFRGGRGTQDHDSLLQGLAHHRLFVPDNGFDVNSYFEAVERLDYDYFCFLNSFCRILDRGWLEKLNRWITQPDVGLVGATGSGQSIATPQSSKQLRGSAESTMSVYRTRLALALRDRSPGALLRGATLRALRMAGIWRPSKDFPSFPNYHVRTNAFMASRQTLLAVRPGPIRTKLSAYKFESGKDGLTNRVLRLGLKVLVVGRDGQGYEPRRWHLSNTFWQSREENLLVADNQTEAYLSAEPASRAMLARYAWGEHARPA